MSWSWRCKSWFDFSIPPPFANIRYGVGGKHAAFQLASSVTVATRPVGCPFVYEATLDASVLSSSSARDSTSGGVGEGGAVRGGATGRGSGRGGTGGKGKGGKGKDGKVRGSGLGGSGGLLAGKQHRWVAELRVRAATDEESALTAAHGDELSHQ